PGREKLYRLCEGNGAAGSALLSGHEKVECERAGSTRGPAARPGIAAESIQGSNCKKGGDARRYANHARIWWRSYSGRNEYWRVAGPLNLGRLDARFERADSSGPRKRKRS